MLLNLLKNSFFNQKKAVFFMVVSIAVGTAIAASLITISFEINGKISKELRSFGANIIVEPKVEGLADFTGLKRYLRYEDIVKVKTIFWRHNILGISPFLDSEAPISFNGKTETVPLTGAWYDKQLPLPGEDKTFDAGIKTVFPWWEIEGRWPESDDQVVVGSGVADRLGLKTGDALIMGNRKVRVTGILETGGKEDDMVFMNIESLQRTGKLEGKISRVSISALTTPMDKFAYKDPGKMSKKEYEKWYCTGYVTSIAKQVEEVFFGSRAKPVWQIAETEGKVLDRLKTLIYLLCFIVIIASAIGVSTTMIMSLLRRTQEIGLMKAIGADKGQIITIFIFEGIIIGLAGGLLGYLISLAASHFIGMRVFNTALEQRAILLPISVVNALTIAVAGTVLPIRRALSVKPGIVLKGAE